VKAVVVGGGGIGLVHAQSYQAAGLQLAAVVEPASAAREVFGERFGIPAFERLEDALDAQLGLDVVSICTPPFAHKENALLAMSAGLHVLCEKPLAHTLEDARAIHLAATSTEVVFATAYCHRFQPEIEFLASQVADGQLGELRAFANEFASQQDDIETRWFGTKALAGGGALLDAGIHSIDIFRLLCGEIETVGGCVSRDLDGVQLDVEHTAVATLRSRSGVLGSIHVSWKTPGGRSFVSISGSKGSLTFDYQRPGQVVLRRGLDESVLDVPTGNRFEREMIGFVQAIETRSAPRTGSIDGLVGLETVDRVYADSAAGQSQRHDGSAGSRQSGSRQAALETP
jgi:predicted dehydrogenase